MTGLVAVRQNRAQGFFFPGMQIPDIREGDTLQPGMPVADVLDISEFEVLARVGELDRANLHEGQDVTMRLDAVPDQHFHGKIKTMSGTASANVFSGDPGKKFDVVFSIDMQQLLTALGAKPADVKRILETAEHNAKKPPPVVPEPNASVDMAKMASELPPEFGTEEERERAKLPPPPEEDSQLQVLLRPGLLTDVEITVERIPNAIHIPAQGVFEKDGQPAVWVQSGRRFEQRVVKLARRSESTMVIAEGLKAGDVIALSDPTAKPSDKKGAKSAVPSVPGGGASGGSN